MNETERIEQLKKEWESKENSTRFNSFLNEKVLNYWDSYENKMVEIDVNPLIKIKNWARK